MLIRLTAAAMLATLVTVSVPTTSHAGMAQCRKLVTDIQTTLQKGRSEGTLERLEEILENMEEQCDLQTFLNAASKVGKFEKLLDKVKD